MAPTLVGWLGSEAPDRQVYERPPLAIALCQVRFTTRYGLAEAVVGKFQEAIESEYPIPDQQQVTAVPLGGVLGIQSPPQVMQWQFADNAGDWTVTLTSDFVTLETRAYQDFDEFLSRLRRVLQTLIITINPRFGRRIGLRYINEIRSENRDWSSIIRPEILGPLTIEPLSENCDQAFQVLSLRAGEARITLQHGPFQTGSTVLAKPGTSPHSEPFYLIDIDMYQDFNPPKALKMDETAICRQVEDYHVTVGELFRWITTDEYRKSLGERDNAR